MIFVQVKVGPNGEIIVDEESTIIETSASKKAKEDLLKAPLVFESANQVRHILLQLKFPDDPSQRDTRLL